MNIASYEIIIESKCKPLTNIYYIGIFMNTYKHLNSLKLLHNIYNILGIVLHNVYNNRCVIIYFVIFHTLLNSVLHFCF